MVEKRCGTPRTKEIFPAHKLNKASQRLATSFSQWLLLVLTGAFFVSPLAAEPAERPAQVPPALEFVRSLDLEGTVQKDGRTGSGSQIFRAQTRYLDPDVNAFVGLLTLISRHNLDLQLGNPDSPSAASYLWTWGGDVGIVRGRHLWELDLMGASLGEHLAFAPGFSGEHRLASHWSFYHRTIMNLFVGDSLLDSDQGIAWLMTNRIGLSAGWRWFTSQHMNRSGPRVGLLLHFQTPKIPFIFPSIG